MKLILQHNQVLDSDSNSVSPESLGIKVQEKPPVGDHSVTEYTLPTGAILRCVGWCTAGCTRETQYVVDTITWRYRAE